MINPFNDDYFMQQALLEAKKALSFDEVPVGAVVVIKDRIIARGHNLTERLNDVTAHAEMLAITAAAEYLGSKYLKECTMYVTLEPCAMCSGALYWSQIERVVIGAMDEKRGASKFTPRMYHPKTLVENGVMENQCSSLLKEFFLQKRN